MEDFIKLSNDDMFKLVFSDKHIMHTFLSRVLGKEIDDDFKIINKRNNQEISPNQVLEYLKQELSNNSVHSKRKRVDLLVKTNNEIIDLEVNNTFNEEIKKRNFSYLTSIYSNYLKHNNKYVDLPKFTQINICSSVSEKYDIDNHFVLGENYNNKLIDNINSLVINVAKYKDLLYTNNEELIKKFAHIIMFDCDKEELELLSRYDDFVREVYQMVTNYNLEDENMFNFFLDEEDEKKLYVSQLEGERIRGEECGIEKNKLQTAKKMLSKHFSFKDIEEITGFSSDYLKTIKV